ncbi:MAG: hypothetical protein K5Q00_06930 [Gammaproteobacteria bacterium]|nr:hypothetical protein [Gammaproteobacteria bacterium]
MASLVQFTIAVSAPSPVIAVLAEQAKKFSLQGQQCPVNGQETWTTTRPIEVPLAYKFLEHLVQAAGPSSNNQRGMNTASSYTPAAIRNNNLNNLLVRNQPLNENQLLLAAADALALAIAKAMVTAVQQNPKLPILPLNYSLPNVPLELLTPVQGKIIYLFGQEVKVQPQRAQMYKAISVVALDTPVSQQIILASFGYHATTPGNLYTQMSLLRGAVDTVLEMPACGQNGQSGDGYYKVTIIPGSLSRTCCERVAARDLKRKQKGLPIPQPQMEEAY